MNKFKEIISEGLFDELNIIIDDAEGSMPVSNITDFLKSHSLSSDVLCWNLAKFLVLKGIDISSNEKFFHIFDDFNNNPGLYLWLSYDSLIRGNLEQFAELWNKYSSIELKYFPIDVINESIVIPEDPIFINVAEFVHDQQNRILSQFVLSKEQRKKLTDSEIDEKLELFLGNISPLLAFFRIQHIQFKRNLSISDLQRLEEILKDETIHDLGPYWEIRVLLLLSYWRLELGLVYDATESITQIKMLNGFALNNWVESHIFHLEALVSINNNNLKNFNELLQSAIYLSSEYNFLYNKGEFLLSKAKYNIDLLLETISQIEQFTNERDHKFIRAKAYVIVSEHFISIKDWNNAEKELLKASKFLHNKFDLNLYYRVIADFSYVLIITKQLKQSLESTQVLIEEEVPMLYRLRGFYLYGASMFFLGDNINAVKFIEEGIREALTYKENISLPWFYELLGLFYICESSWNTSLKYFELTFKSYFENSNVIEGYRSRIITSYLLALDNNFGSAFTQIQNLLADGITNSDILFEVIWALQSIIALSRENVEFRNYTKIWNENGLPLINQEENPLITLVNAKSEFFMNSSLNDGAVLNFNEIVSDSNKFYIELDFILWKILLNIKTENNEDFVDLLTNQILEQVSKINVKMKIIPTVIDVLQNRKAYDQKNVENYLVKLSMVTSSFRNLKLNMPFPEFL